MTRPSKGTPEYDLWVAAIEIAIYPPLRHDDRTTWAAKVPWNRIEELRAALDKVGIDWRATKITDDAAQAEAAARRGQDG